MSDTLLTKAISEASNLDVVVERHGFRFLVTSTYQAVIGGNEVRLNLLTPIPDGATPEDMGRKFPMARLEGANLPMILDDLRRLVAEEISRKSRN